MIDLFSHYSMRRFFFHATREGERMERNGSKALESGKRVG